MPFKPLLLLFILLSACAKPRAYEYELSSESIVSIPIDPDISPIFSSSNFDPSSRSLVFSNRNIAERSLLVADIYNKTIKKIEFQKEGTNSIPSKTVHYFYKNADSIFFVGGLSKKIALFNDLGEVINRYDINFDDLTSDTAPFYASMGAQDAILKKETIQLVLEPVNMRYMSKSQNDPIFGYFNLKNEKVDHSKIKYSLNSDYNYPLQHPWLSLPLVETGLQYDCIFTFGQSKTIYFCKNDSIVKKIDFESDYFNKYKKMEDFDNIEKHYFTSPANERIILDENNQNLYLFVSTSIEDFRADEQYNYQNKPFLVIVFNKEGEKVFEKNFEKNKYSIMGSFVDANKLYLSLNNQNSPSLDEDKINFEVFVLKQP